MPFTVRVERVWRVSLPVVVIRDFALSRIATLYANLFEYLYNRPARQSLGDGVWWS